MKKILTIAIIGFALYSCSKKITPTVTKTTTDIGFDKQSTLQPPMRTEISNEKSFGNPPKVSEMVDTVVSKKTDKIVEGQSTYKIKCSKCHELHDTEEFTAAKWVKIIDWMAPKARLEPEEKENVLAYVSAYAKK